MRFLDFSYNLIYLFCRRASLNAAPALITAPSPLFILTYFRLCMDLRLRLHRPGPLCPQSLREVVFQAKQGAYANPVCFQRGYRAALAQVKGAAVTLLV